MSSAEIFPNTLNVNWMFNISSQLNINTSFYIRIEIIMLYIYVAKMTAFSPATRISVLVPVTRPFVYVTTTNYYYLYL